MKSSRIAEIDILKAVAIIMMVLGHSGAPFTAFIFLFHMAVFLIAAGFTYNPESSDSRKSVLAFIKKKIIRLWLPCFLTSVLFTLLNNWFLRVNLLTDNPELLEYTKNISVLNLSRLKPCDEHFRNAEANWKTGADTGITGFS